MIRWRGRFLLLAARVLSAVLQALLLVLLVRAVPIEEFGLYAVATSVGAILTGLLGMGVATRVLRLPVIDADRYRFTVLVLAPALGALAAVLVWCCLLPSGGGTWLVAAAIFAGSEMYGGIIQNLFFGEQRIGRANSFMVLRRALPLAALLLSAATGGDVFFSLAAGFVGSFGLTALIAGGAPSRRLHIRELLVSSRHYWVANTAAMAQQLDVPLLAVFLGSPVAGAYAAAFRLASPVHLVTSIIVSTAVPAISRATEYAERRLLEIGVIRNGIAYACLIAILSPVMSWVGPLVLGAQFDAFAWIFPLMFLNSAVSVVNQVLSAVLYAAAISKQVAFWGTIATTFGLAVMVVGGAMGSVVLAVGGAPAIQMILLIALATLVFRHTRAEPGNEAV